MPAVVYLALAAALIALGAAASALTCARSGRLFNRLWAPRAVALALLCLGLLAAMPLASSSAASPGSVFREAACQEPGSALSRGAAAAVLFNWLVPFFVFGFCPALAWLVPVLSIAEVVGVQRDLGDLIGAGRAGGGGKDAVAGAWGPRGAARASAALRDAPAVLAVPATPGGARLPGRRGGKAGSPGAGAASAPEGAETAKGAKGAKGGKSTPAAPSAPLSASPASPPAPPAPPPSQPAGPGSYFLPRRPPGQHASAGAARASRAPRTPRAPRGGRGILYIALPVAVGCGLAALGVHCLPYALPRHAEVYAKTRLPEMRDDVLWLYRLGFLPPYSATLAEDPCEGDLTPTPKQAPGVGWNTLVIESAAHTVALPCVLYKALLTAVLSSVGCCRVSAVRTNHAGARRRMILALTAAGCLDVLLTLGMLLGASAPLGGTGGDQAAVPPNAVLLAFLFLDALLLIVCFGVRALPAYPRPSALALGALGGPAGRAGAKRWPGEGESGEGSRWGSREGSPGGLSEGSGGGSPSGSPGGSRSGSFGSSAGSGEGSAAGDAKGAKGGLGGPGGGNSPAGGSGSGPAKPPGGSSGASRSGGSTGASRRAPRGGPAPEPPPPPSPPPPDAPLGDDSEGRCENWGSDDSEDNGAGGAG